jgi:iron(III) transport system ATP-binding protein
MGLLAPDAGRIRVGGSVLVDAEEAATNGRRRKRRGVEVAPDKRSIGYVAQEAALFPHLSAGENIGFGLSWAERRRGDRVAQMLDLVGLDQGYRDRRPHELSGGEQRRVALARALAPAPRLVLLDEPFSGLDAALRVETREAVLEALAKERATALLVTHDQAEALSMGREVAVLRDGTLVQRAAPATLYRQPVDLRVARFVGDAVVLDGLLLDGRVLCALGDLEASGQSGGGDLVQAMIRPEQIRLVHDGDPSDPRRTVGASVIDRTCHGPDTVLRLALTDAPATIVKARTLERVLPEPGARVGLTVAGPVVVYPLSRAPGEAEAALERLGVSGEPGPLQQRGGRQVVAEADDAQHSRVDG